MQIEIKHYELSDAPWWAKFCLHAKFQNEPEINEYLSGFGGAWVGRAEGHVLTFEDEAGLSMFILRWS